MINRNKLYLIFGGFFLIVFLIVFYKDFTLTGKESISDNNSFISFAKDNKNEFTEIANLFDQYIDTSFYAEYRLKLDRFEVFYMRNDTIGDIKNLSSSDENKCFSKAKFLGVRKVWMFNGNNFYLILMNKNIEKKFYLLLLKKSENEFHFDSTSNFLNYPIVKNKVEADQFRTSFLHPINKEIIVFVKVEN